MLHILAATHLTIVLWCNVHDTIKKDTIVNLVILFQNILNLIIGVNLVFCQWKNTFKSDFSFKGDNEIREWFNFNVMHP